jgi:glycosyltransferase involved in cell wall biosynthesis
MQGPTRHYYFMRELAREHSITLLTPTRSKVTPEAMQEISSFTEEMLVFDATRNAKGGGNGKGRPASMIAGKITELRRANNVVREMKKSFLNLVQEGAYDLVLFHGKNVFAVIEDWDDLPIVIDLCDATSMRIAHRMRFASKAKLPWLMWRYARARQTEKKMVEKTSHVAFITGRDREAILGPGSTAAVLPNMVDLQYWERKTHHPQANCIMYSGGMDYRPNVDGALVLINQIVPILRRSIDDLQVLIVGRDPAKELIDAAQGQSDIVITGAVDDMRPYFERSSVYVAPLRYASGQQNKLIEAMAMEVPVVTTQVAAEGMRFDDGEEVPVLVADDERQFADSVVSLLGDAEKRADLAKDGRRFIEKHFVRSSSVGVLENMCAVATRGNQVSDHIGTAKPTKNDSM